MIGGVDIVVGTRLEPAESLDLCTRILVDRWPGAVLEDAITGEQFAGYSWVPFKLVAELMVYRDHVAFEGWRRLGADPSNTNSMVHLLTGERDEVTIVVDDHCAPDMREILEEMADALERASMLREAAWREAA